MANWLPQSLLANFALGMDRVENVKEFEPFPDSRGLILNLGAGRKDIDRCVSLDADIGWWAPRLTYIDQTVVGIIAYHFFEHLDKDTLLSMLLECERVLKPGGLINFLVPYYSSQIAFMDIDHKLFFNEKTFPTIFSNKYYSGTRIDHKWKLSVHMQMIMGLEERNMALVGQLIKGD